LEKQEEEDEDAENVNKHISMCECRFCYCFVLSELSEGGSGFFFASPLLSVRLPLISLVLLSLLSSSLTLNPRLLAKLITLSFDPLSLDNEKEEQEEAAAAEE
jgi:hypothetical protein